MRGGILPPGTTLCCGGVWWSARRRLHSCAGAWHRRAQVAVLGAQLALWRCWLSTRTRSSLPVQDRVVAARRWRSWERNLRFVAVWAAFITLTAFYLIPIIAIQAVPRLYLI